MDREVNRRGEHRTTRVHLEATCPASVDKTLGRLVADVALWPRYSSFSWLALGMENQLMLAMERMARDNRTSNGAKLMQLEVTLLTGEPLTGTILLTATADKEFW